VVAVLGSLYMGVAGLGSFNLPGMMLRLFAVLAKTACAVVYICSIGERDGRIAFRVSCLGMLGKRLLY
jgi:hypothetical protein